MLGLASRGKEGLSGRAARRASFVERKQRKLLGQGTAGGEGEGVPWTVSS